MFFLGLLAGIGFLFVAFLLFIIANFNKFMIQ